MKSPLLTAAALACALSACRAEDVLPKVEPIRRLKPLYPRTLLVEAGQPRALIVLPDAQEYAALAQKLQQALARVSSATLPVRSAATLVDDDWRFDFRSIGKQNIIALGNVNNNRLLSVLYGQGYVVADSIYPGKRGHVVRTVHDPFARGVNVLALEGSDADGVNKAIDVLLDKFVKGQGKTIALAEPVVDVEFERKAYRFFPDATHFLTSKRQPQYTGMAWFKGRCQAEGFMDADGKVVPCRENKTLVPLLSMIARIGQTYFRRGDRELLPLMKELLDKNRHLLENPAKVHDMGGRSSSAVHQWDLLEELPVWTDQDRLDVTNALLRDAALGCERRAFHKQVKDGAVQTLDENHGTCSALRSFEAWHYFHKYYPSPASDYWMRCARAVFSAQASTHQILEDACGYLCYCPVQTLAYTLRSGDLTYIKRGVMKTHAEYIALACMNNLGLPTGFGDASGVVQPAFFEALAPAAWFYRDARLYWIVRNRLPQACGLRIFQNSIAFDLTVEPRVPSEWTGLIRVPLYESPLAKGRMSKTPVFADKTDVDPKLFNKLVFKENWDPQGQYLLLDGAGCWGGPPGPHGHKHNDINTIINFTSHGRMWLVDHTYQVRAFQDHSGLYVTSGGVGGYRKRTLATLKDLFQTQQYGLSRTQFVNTDRAIFWRKGRHFLVVDRAVADKDGEYFARCSFRALGDAEVKGRALRLSQKGRFCRIVSDGAANLDLEHYEYSNTRDWETFYPHAKPVVRIFQQDKSRSLKKGQAIGFLNLLYACADEKAANDVQMKAVSETCALVTDRGHKALLGVGEAIAGLGATDMFVASEEQTIALSTTAFPAGLVSSDSPCDLCLDPARQEVRVRSRVQTRLALAGRLAKAEEGGRTLPMQQTAQGAVIALSPGDHTIELRDWNGFARAADLVRKAIDAAESGAERSEARVSGEPEVNGLAVETVTLSGSIHKLIVADVDGGAPEWIVARDTGVALYRPDGAEVWKFDTPQPVRCLDVGDLNRDGRADIVAGCDDVHVYGLDAQGHKKWTFVCKKSEGSIDGPARVDYVKIDDLDADGKPEVVVGANWLHVLDANGQLKWEKYMDYRRGRVCGDFVCGHVDDIDGDGRKEIIALFMTSYPLLQVFDPNGKKILPSGPSTHGGINIDVPIAVTALDLFGGQRAKQIVYCGRSRLGFLWHDHRPGEQAGGKVSGSFVAMASFQPDPTQPPVLLAADTICGIVAAKPKPKRHDRWIDATRLWYRSLGEKISALTAGDVDRDGQGEVYVGTKRGSIHVLDLANGATLGFARLKAGRVTAFTCDPKRRRMLAAMDDGRVVALALKQTPERGMGR